MAHLNPTQHRMTRRCASHDYSTPGIYHITMHVAESLGQPLGCVVGNAAASDGEPDAPRVQFTQVGQMVEHELLHSIARHYPMVEVQVHVVMPEHLHVILEVHETIVTTQGRHATLGQIIAGFKKGCNRRYWELTGQAALFEHQGSEAHQGKPDGTNAGSNAGAPATVPAASTPATATTNAATAPATGTLSPASVGAPAVCPQGEQQAAPRPKVPSTGTTGRQPLFAPGYCDVMPLHRGQLATQRAYILANPRSRLLRSQQQLRPQRGAIRTALTAPALMGYLQRECPPAIATPEALAALQLRLLLSGAYILCDTYGDRSLLERRLLPVVCHRCDAARFEQQKARCLEEAAHGAILVSARIARGEQAIIDEAVQRGFPVVLIHDNGFPDRYHPSANRLALCATSRLLLVTPWRYAYQPSSAAITVPQCKAMNCLAQALARIKDNWWQ